MICPNCNIAKLTPIWYGNPSIDEIILAREDQIVLGGPDVKPYTHYCYMCQDTHPVKEKPFSSY